MPLPRRALATGALAALALTAGLAAPALAARVPGAQFGKSACPPGVDPRLALCLPQPDHARPGPVPDDWRPYRHRWRAPNGNPGPLPPVLPRY